MKAQQEAPTRMCTKIAYTWCRHILFIISLIQFFFTIIKFLYVTTKTNFSF